MEVERGRGKEIFHLLIHSPDDHNGQHWEKLETGSRSFFPGLLRV